MKLIVQVEQDADGKWRLDLFSPFKGEAKNQQPQGIEDLAEQIAADQSAAPAHPPVGPNPAPPAKPASSNNKVIAAILAGCAIIAAFLCVAVVAVSGTLLFLNSPLRAASQSNPFAKLTATSTVDPLAEPVLEGEPTEEGMLPPPGTEDLTTETPQPGGEATLEENVLPPVETVDTNASTGEEESDPCELEMCTEPKPGCEIKAVTDADMNMYYYLPTHKNYAIITLDPELSDRYYCSAASADNSGYFPAP